MVGKECTNKQLSSHSLRYQLLSSKNESWREEMFSHYHLTPTDDSAWSNLFPRKILKEEERMSWEMMYRRLKSPDNLEKGNSFLREVSLHNVRLNINSFHFRAQQTNLEYLLMLDVDSLVWRHYLSATAQMWASTHNDTLHKKMSAVVSALEACQTEMGTGYLSAFPSEFFDRFESLKEVWAPYYTIHKILAGLLDQYTLANNNEALRMTIWMVDYFSNRVQNVIAKYSIERHWKSLNEETGGMNDVLYNLYSITGDLKHLILAHLFDKPCFLGLLALEMRYEVTGDPLYKAIGTYFMDVVNSSHTYATGGTSVGEFWSDPKRLASRLERDTVESCTTYNMLKVSRNLFRWTKEAAYADYYERALTNGVLSIQRGTDHGIMIYMLPLGPGGSKSRKVRLLSTLNLCIPSWTYSKGFKATLNTDDLPLSSPGSFLSISRIWWPDDKLTLQMPMSLRTETVQDERSEYASVQAILYGPYLLAGLTSGDWEIRKRRVNSLSDWVTPVPSSYSSQLVSVSQASGGEEFVFTNLSVHATFRLILKDVNSSLLLSLVDYIGKSVMIELFNLPGMLVMHTGTNNNLRVTNSEVASEEDNKASLFRVVEGLDLKDGTVSLESEHLKGCFIYSGVTLSEGMKVQLKCKPASTDLDFIKAASFSFRRGFAEYHPISSIAKGAKRNFLMMPL
ncbi:hypothetical protein MKX03_000787 [Papaver bracteatum]|nr:hypothetical protein MKX03_000787 [Papaver bracteatum]